MAELSLVERLRKEVEDVARSNSPLLSMTVQAPDSSRIHSATTWFAPTETLDLLTFSSPTRLHSQFIDRNTSRGKQAIVSGTVREDGQEKSDPGCHGLAYEGHAWSLTDPEEISDALARFTLFGTFTEDEIDKYLNHPTLEVPPHRVYLLRPNLWTVMDGRLGSNNPDRLINIEWPPKN